MAQCAAKSKRSGEQCRRRASRGQRVCRMHGANSRRGDRHPNFKHGLFSRHLPDGLRRLARQVLRDQGLLSVREEAALVEALKLHRLYRLKANKREPDAADETALLALMHAKLACIDRVERAQRWKTKTITAGQLERFLAYFIQATHRHVLDEEARRALQSDLRQAVRGGRFDDDDAE